MLKAASLVLFVFACFAITSLMFFPGGTDSDTNTIISEAFTQSFSTWHSATVAYVLRACYKQSSTFFGPYDLLFIFSFSCYWTALGLIARANFDALAKQLFYVLACGFFPASFLLMLSINKDSMMCSTLLLAYAFLETANGAQSRSTRLFSSFAAIPMLFLSTATRHNAVLATGPLCINLFRILSEREDLPRLKDWRTQTLLGITLCSLLFFSNASLEKNVIHAREDYPQQALLVWDLVNISVLANENCLPPNYTAQGKPVDVSFLKQHYCQYCCDPIFWWGKIPHFTLTTNGEEISQLQRFWLKAVSRYPFQYLEHRLDAMLSLLGVINQTKQIVPSYYFLMHQNRTEEGSLEFLNSPCEIAIHKIAESPAMTIPEQISTAWPYISFLIILLVLAKRHKSLMNSRQLFLTLSGLLYSAGFMFVGVGDNQRYMTYPLCVSAILLASIIADYSRLKRATLSP